MPAFLTVKEAAERFNKSLSSIRRIIYPIVKDDQHPDRGHIQPSVEDVKKLRLNGESFPWKISDELLRRELPAEPAAEKGTSSPRQASAAEGELLAMLRHELEIKNQQISQQADALAKQMQLTSELSERIREGNVLIGSLQQRLPLTDGRGGTKPDGRQGNKAEGPVEVTPPVSTPAPKGSKVAAKPAPPKKKGLFRRWFS